MAEELSTPGASSLRYSEDSYGAIHRDNPATSSFSFRQLASTRELGINADLGVLYAIWNAYEDHDSNKIDEILAQACEDLAQAPNKYHYLSLVYVSKKLPELFSLKRTFKAVLRFFNSSNHHADAKKYLILPLLACNLFLRAFEPVPHWPLEFVRIYLDDAVGPRTWIDHDGCKDFVTNIVTAFSDHNGVPGAVKNRYQSIELRSIVREEFLKSVHFLLGSSTKENIKQLLKLLIQGVGYEEIRVVGSSMLESWLNSPIHLRAAKMLLDNILDNLHGITNNDILTVKNLLTLQLQSASQVKTLLGNIYTEMIARLVSQRYEYGTLALKTFVTAEMTSKSLFNMRCISIVMKSVRVSQPPEYELAKILQEQALNIGSQSQLYELGCRLFKYLGQNLNLHALCNGLLQPFPKIINQTEVLRKSWLSQIIDLACQFLLYGVSCLTVNEHFAQTIKGLMSCTSRIPDHENFTPFQEALSTIEKKSYDILTFQVDALEWCTNILSVMPEISSFYFTSVVQKLLFLEKLETYFPSNEKYGDMELNSFNLVCACTQASEEILTRLIYMGISKDIPLTRREALQIVERLVLRAAISSRYLSCTLKAESIQLPLAIFKLASVELPHMIAPQSMELVYKDLHWRSCVVVLMIAIYNLKSIGNHVWKSIPSVKYLMELLLKSEGASEIVRCNDNSGVEDIDVCRKEKEMEELIAKHLLSITTANSLALSGDIMEWKEEMMLIDYSITLRKAFPSVLKEINEIEQLYQLSHLLRKCTDPDFFTEFTTSQTLPHSWSWLKRVLTKEPALVKRLPLPWQVELLYIYEGFYPGNRLELSYLYASLHMSISQDNKNMLADVEMIFNYFVHKLVSAEFCIRSRARRCLSGILDPSCVTGSDSSGQSFGWLLSLHVVSLPKNIFESLIAAICRAIQLESSFDVVIAYLVFLEQHLPSIQSSHSLALVVANLIIKRRMLSRYLLKHSQKVHISGRFPQSINVASTFIKILRDVLGGSFHPLSDESMKSQTVILVLPIFNEQKDVVKKKIPKYVVDAIIELLTQLSVMGFCNDDYESMIEVLFPGFLHPQNDGDKLSMAWMEDSFGRQITLLSESQAYAFCHCNDARLIRVGFSMLSTGAKIEAITSLGVSSIAIESFLGNHKSVLNLSDADQSKEDYMSKMKNGWMKRELMQLIVSVSENASSGTVKNTQLQSSIFNKGTESILSTTGRISDRSFQDVLSCSIPRAPTHSILSYLQVRRYLQEVNFCSEPETWLQKAEILLKELFDPDVKRGVLNETLSLRLQLPLYVSLSGCKKALIHLKHDKINCPSAEVIKQWICTLTQNVQKLVGRNQCHGHEDNTVSQENFSSVVAQILLLMKEMDKFLSEDLQENMIEAYETGYHVQDCRVDIENKCSLLNLENITFENIESTMMRLMQLRCYIGQDHAMQTDILLKFVDTLFVLSNNYLAQDILGFDRHIASAGVNALYINLVEFSYVDLISCDHLMNVFKDLSLHATELCLQWVIVPLILRWIFYQSSWEFAMHTLQCLLTTIEFSLQNGVFQNGTNTHDTICCHSLINHFLLFGAVLDFIHFILHRPFSRLTSSRDGSEYSQKFTSAASASAFTPLSVKIICNLIILVSVLSSILTRQCCTIDERHNSILRSFESGAIREYCLKYRETASGVLIHMSSQHDQMLRMIVNQLFQGIKKVEWPLFDHSNFGRHLEEEHKASAKSLLLMLYTIWPLSLQLALPTMNYKDLITTDVLLKMDPSQSQFHECTLQRGRSCKYIVQEAVTFSLCNSVNENDASYRFCRTFVKQHPMLFLRCMPALGGLLKDYLEMVKLEDIEARKKVACSLKMGIILLDSLRPYIFHNTPKTKDKDDRVNTLLLSGLPNSVLHVYMEFLQCLESQDITYYGTVIAKVANFLCHCVSIGGRWCDFVKDHQNLVLEASMKFGKIKKLSYVLTLLDNFNGNDSNNSDTAETTFTPSMPLEEVRTVRQKLLQFSYFEKKKVILDDESTISSNRKRKWDDRFAENEIKDYSIGLLSTLTDLEQASSRLPSILSLLRDVLVDLMHVTDPEISDIVYNLLERSLYECPSDNDYEVMETLIMQLASSNSVESKTAESQAARFFFFFPELQETLLIQMFRYAPQGLRKLFGEITRFLS